MIYRIVLETHAKKEFLHLPREAQIKIGDIFDDLKIAPRPPAAKKLTGQEGYRIRKGDYRILYTINDSQSLVTVYRVGHRREVYR